MDHHELGGPAAPHKAAQVASVEQRRRGPADRRRIVEGQAVLGSVLVEQPELVVLDTLAHE